MKLYLDTSTSETVLRLDDQEYRHDFGHDLAENSQTVSGVLGDAGVVGQQSNHFPAGIVPDDGEQLVHLVAFAGDRVDDAGLVAELPGFGQNIGAGGVHSDGQIGNFLDAVDHPLQGFQFFALGNGSAAVNVSSAGIGLGDGAGLDELGITLGNGLGYGGDGTVNLFATDYHVAYLLYDSFLTVQLEKRNSKNCAFHPCLSYQM